MEKLDFCYCGNAFTVIEETIEVNDGTITCLYRCLKGHEKTTQLRLEVVRLAYPISKKTRVLYKQIV